MGRRGPADNRGEMIHASASRPPSPPPAQLIAYAGRNPRLHLHVTRTARAITVTAAAAPRARGHLSVAESGDGLGSWTPVGATERFTGLTPGSWTLTVTWVGTGGWATETVTRRLSA